MSRVGKKIYKLPQGVSAEMKGQNLFVKGPKGELSIKVHPRVTVVIENNELSVRVVNETNKKDRSLWGTFSSIAGSMIQGVSEGFVKKLEVNGVGYKINMQGDVLVLVVGYSHPVEFKSPKGITISVEKNIITVEGADKQVVGETAAQIRKIRKPEPYQGKGIKYVDEVIRRKVGKTASKSS